MDLVDPSMSSWLAAAIKAPSRLKNINNNNNNVNKRKRSPPRHDTKRSSVQPDTVQTVNGEIITPRYDV